MHDCTAAVLFASTDWPAKALAMVRETWLTDGVRPVEIRVFRGGKTKAVRRAVVVWNESERVITSRSSIHSLQQSRCIRHTSRGLKKLASDFDRTYPLGRGRRGAVALASVCTRSAGTTIGSHVDLRLDHVNHVQLDVVAKLFFHARNDLGRFRVGHFPQHGPNGQALVLLWVGPVRLACFLSHNASPRMG
jgi:hypothetical protein